MAENTLHLRLPVLPDPALFQDPERTILTTGGGALLSYDLATRTGFIYERASQRWTISTPIEFDMFAALVALGGYQLAASEDTRRWIAACLGDAPPGAAVH